MPKLEYFVVAESYAVDRDTGAVSLFNILSKIRTPRVPFAIPRMIVAAYWLCDPDELDVDKEYPVAVRFHVPGQTEPLVEHGTLSTTASALLSVFEVANAGFDCVGELIAEILLDGEVCESHRVLIELVPAE